MSCQSVMMVAAIDFGTTFSGYAYSFVHDYTANPLKINTHEWSTGTDGTRTLKTPTTILLKSDKSFHSFGYEAENKYSKLCEKGNHGDWYYFRRFKMMLYRSKKLTRSTMLKDVNDKELPARDIFMLSIRYLKDHLLGLAKDRLENMSLDLIRWILTVPAIWDDAAKQFMREAAQKAGIRGDRLVLALEPEAASTLCNYVPMQVQNDSRGQLQASTLSPGTRYMVLDIGGGTVDITVHEVQMTGDLKELHTGTGDALGGLEIDNAFSNFLRKIYDNDVLLELRDKCMEDYLEIFRNFESKKRNVDPASTEGITMRIPHLLNDIFNKRTGQTLEDALKNPFSANR